MLPVQHMSSEGLRGSGVTWYATAEAVVEDAAAVEPPVRPSVRLPRFSVSGSQTLESYARSSARKQYKPRKAGFQ